MKNNMKHLRKFENFKINEEESLKNWISTAMLLLSLGVVSAKDMEDNPKGVKEVIDTMGTKTIDSLNVIKDIKNESEDVKVDGKSYQLLSLNKSYDIFKNSPSNEFIKYTNQKNFPINMGVYLIDFEMFQNIPLYNLNFNIGGTSTTISTTDISGKFQDISIDLSIKNNYYIGFTQTSRFSILGFKYKF
jgi:hypothetical protein